MRGIMTCISMQVSQSVCSAFLHFTGLANMQHSHVALAGFAHWLVEPFSEAPL